MMWFDMIVIMMAEIFNTTLGVGTEREGEAEYKLLNLKADAMGRMATTRKCLANRKLVFDSNESAGISIANQLHSKFSFLQTISISEHHSIRLVYENFAQ